MLLKKDVRLIVWKMKLYTESRRTGISYEGWNFNFGNAPLDWIQELLE